jgi:hypothetical protein
MSDVRTGVEAQPPNPKLTPRAEDPMTKVRRLRISMLSPGPK